MKRSYLFIILLFAVFLFPLVGNVEAQSGFNGDGSPYQGCEGREGQPGCERNNQQQNQGNANQQNQGCEGREGQPGCERNNP
jgi:hypothetical protein